MFALGVIGALVGGIFFAARLEQQSGQNALFAVQAGEAAEAGLSEAVATLDPAALELLPVGGTPLDLGTLTLAGGAGASRQASRLTQHLFLIRARGIQARAQRAASWPRGRGLAGAASGTRRTAGLIPAV